MDLVPRSACKATLQSFKFTSSQHWSISARVIREASNPNIVSVCSYLMSSTCLLGIFHRLRDEQTRTAHSAEAPHDNPHWRHQLLTPKDKEYVSLIFVRTNRGNRRSPVAARFCHVNNILYYFLWIGSTVIAGVPQPWPHWVSHARHPIY